jgi:hypothetical protein
VADDEYVFWIDEAVEGARGRVMRLDRHTGAVDELAADLSNPVGLRKSDDWIVFTNDFGGTGDGTVGVFKVPKRGGAVERLDPVDERGAGRLAVRAGVALSEAWSERSVRVRRSEVDLAGTGVDCEYVYESDGPGRITAIGAVTDAAHFADSSTDAILRVGYDCGSAPTPFSPNQPGVRWLIGGTQRLYWITEDMVLRQRYSDAEPELVAGGLDDATGFTLLGSDVLVTSRSSGTVTRVSASAKDVLGCHQGGPWGITDTDDGVIYWTNKDSGEIVELALSAPVDSP